MRYHLKTFMWEATRACNLSCSHCGMHHAPHAQPELSTSEACDVIAQLSELGCLYLSLTGGEPSLRNDLPALVSHASAQGIMTTLVTNGTRIDARTASLLANAGLSAAAVSIDGGSDFHRINRGATSYARANSALARFHEAGILTCANMMVADGNAAAVPAVHAHCMVHGIDRLNLYLPQDVGRVRENNVSLGIDGFVDIVSYADSHARDETSIFLDDSFGPFQDCFACTAGKSHLSLSATGDILPCISYPHPLGNVREMSLHEAWESPKLALFRDFDPDSLDEPCGSCDSRTTCGGGCRARALQQTGDFYAANRECKDLHDRKPSTAKKLLSLATIGGLAAASVYAAGCLSSDLPEQQPPSPDETTAAPTIQNVSFELNSSASDCIGKYPAVIDFTCDKNFPLDDLVIYADGYPIHDAFDPQSVEVTSLGDGKTQYRLRTTYLFDEFFVEPRGVPTMHSNEADEASSLALDFAGDDTLASHIGSDYIVLDELLPLKSGAPLNLYLASSQQLSADDISVSVNEHPLSLIRLVKLEDDPLHYLATAATENESFEGESTITITVKEHELVKKVTFADPGPYYVNETFLTMCPMIPQPEPRYYASVVDDSVVLASRGYNSYGQPNLLQPTIIKKTPNPEYPSTSGYRPEFLHEKLDVELTHDVIDGYGDTYTLKKELPAGDYAISFQNLTDVEDISNWHISADINTPYKLKHIHVLT